MSHLNQNKKILNRIRRIQGQTNALEQNRSLAKVVIASSSGLPVQRLS